MLFGLGNGTMDLIWMQVLVTTSTDPDTIAAVDAFNAYFSLTFQFGMLAFLATLIFTLLARS